MGDEPAATAARITDEARRIGFHRVGFAAVGPWARHDVYRSWLDAGHAGEMGYLARDAAPRRDPRALLDTARTVVTVALSYARPDPAPAADAADVARGTVARYARGVDYHHLLKVRLHALAEAIGVALGRPVAYRACVDTAPLLEREAAHAGGVGFIAKSTMIIAPGLGSWVLLGELLLDVDVGGAVGPPAEPRCGRCRACLDACPTGAFVDAYTLDARRCISYLTIELPGAIPRELRSAVGDRVFGCDVCQDVCPFNHGEEARTAGDPLLAGSDPRRARPSLVELLELRAAQYRRLVGGTAMRRVHRAQLARNAAVALGNVGGAREVPALLRALGDRSPLVRAHVAWALGRLVVRRVVDAEAVRAALVDHRAQEGDPSVVEELDAALAAIAAG